MTLTSLYLLLSICILNPCLNCDLPQRLALVNRSPLSTNDPNLTYYLGKVYMEYFTKEALVHSTSRGV
ncbi:hypothetical protein PR003_g385 [Phytophthora rubi]|uniref:RxLR effector protein n=1 Tax=Phytophthora rubi TaxID=129364 RepID=A0A6A3NZW4_9STRA|nr:hypothetical protein PR002_g309 [Phytophthora rubi]KAE9052679.1 hypothetical protein PR001_g286 [Phytophthora rubi]KAE9360178.1 hypothetical protein PR003_g385 [Phytophthora rubi]